jgi:hypothetical protein
MDLGLGAALGGLEGVILQMSSSIEGVAALMNPIGLLAQGFIAVVGDVLNSGLMPLIGIIVQVGHVLGSILLPFITMSANAFQALAELWVWGYNNVFRHIFNILIGVANVVQMAFWSLMQAIVNIVNAIPFVNIRNPMGAQPRSLTDGMLDAITLDGMGAAGADASGYTGPGAAAQYTTGRNITINQEINVQHLVGTDGFREFAVMVRDEILEVERMGV